MVALSFMVSEKFPSMSVAVPFVVPTSVIFAPMIASPFTSFTVHFTVRFCC